MPPQKMMTSRKPGRKKTNNNSRATPGRSSTPGGRSAGTRGRSRGKSNSAAPSTVAPQEPPFARPEMTPAQEEVAPPAKTTLKFKFPGLGDFLRQLEAQEKEKAGTHTASQHEGDVTKGRNADEDMDVEMDGYTTPVVEASLIVKLKVPRHELEKLEHNACATLSQQPDGSTDTAAQRSMRDRSGKQQKLREAVKNLNLGSDGSGSSPEVDTPPKPLPADLPVQFGYPVDSPRADTTGPIPPSDYDGVGDGKESSSTSPTGGERTLQYRLGLPSTAASLAPKSKYPVTLPSSLSHLDPNIASIHSGLVSYPVTLSRLPTLFESAISNTTTILYPNQSAPRLSVDPETEIPWTSKHLFHLYILSHHHAYSHLKPKRARGSKSNIPPISEKSIHICDLIADTWIRAFQRLDDNRRAYNRPGIWRANKSSWFAEQKRKFSDCTYLSDDADLAPDVTVFQPYLLRELYAHTAPNCGARLVWADALALRGSWLMREMKQRGIGRDEWPQELVWDVLQTSLRLARERLTLKCEERDPKEWCARYHEHGKRENQVACFRDVAKAEEEARKAAMKEDEESEEDGSVQMMDVDNEEARRKRRKSVAFAQDISGGH
ncbi:uncharacterized protein EI97DRAFT_324234 [Westerdykella ornata]|uniref:Uncharacterized protein n=1 Tax=Westerdykella ornata TaxID=318751 RepID=A0A6A6JJP8_WESOR|nr:uncharacterized protein EI97DRAFT_324234 [Westerdykella ornata]KAF2276870.1 hypothetical protein EI97DRAFT_324234 [Westerdykella ornata]